MGWNEGFTIMEATVVGAYDLGKLDKALLEVLMRPYAGSDIDSGGRVGTLAKDGKSVERIVLHVSGVDVPPAPEDGASEEEIDEHFDLIDELFWEVTEGYGWQ